MSIKRILVHLSHHEEQNRVRLDAGIALASRHEAQLHGLFVIEPADVPGSVVGRGASLAYLAETTELIKEQAHAIGAEFKEHCDRERISWNWSCVEGDTLKMLADRSFAADLVLVGQQESGGLDDAITLHRADYLPLLAASPVLILPRRGRTDVAMQDIMVAWKPDRSCARALHDALPLLVQAKRVTLLTVDPPPEWNLPDTALGDYLAAHSVPVSVETRASGAFDSVSDVIFAAAGELGSDLLVAGAHGHSRLAEFFFGGATHDILRAMPIPVLMSH
jgi:nucleotide-binding universal stress UspA family protein